MLQAVALFLLVMLLLGGFGKLRRWLERASGKRLGGPRVRDQSRLNKPDKCPRCGRFLIGDDRCDCGRG
ncbi:hypothetical protein [Rhodobaculum claviforme]|uniref:Uncharacterized protein n=1 Tax=Rhodobaculum claviforme TaxID=1549854 RepID=A0A934WJS3_9RHOB|nr:hypothetical protein [Rhodobaculum claviforme]MBK5928232.1 hypothetical protein [Rhodobaculum claviforme]